MNRFALLLLAVAPLFAAADPKLLALMPSDAKFMAGADITQAKGSPLIQSLIARFGAEAVQPGGFDFGSDLHEVLAAGSSEKDLVVVLRGAFPAASAVDAIKAIGVHRGVTLYDATDGLAGAQLNGNLALVGSRARVEAAIDRWVDGGTATSALSMEAARVSGASHLWVACNDLSAINQAAGTTKDPQMQMMQNLANTLLKITAGINFGDQSITATSAVTARTAQDAQGLADLFKLLTSMQQPNSPYGTFAPVITAQGDTVNLSLSIPQTLLEQMLPH
jgi:hypothetical protein